MNKTILFLVCISMLAFSSCTQEYICTCEVSYEGNQPGLPEPASKEFYLKNTHDEATKLCEEKSTEFTSADDIKMTQNCRLF